MADRRQKNQTWQVAGEDGKVLGWDAASVAVLMDLRDELKTLNNVFQCRNFLAVPDLLREIKRNTTKRCRKAKR